MSMSGPQRNAIQSRQFGNRKCQHLFEHYRSKLGLKNHHLLPFSLSLYGSHRRLPRLTSWQAQIKQVETFYGIDKSRVCWWQKSASQVSLLLRIRTRQGKTPGNADQSTVAVGCCITRAAPTWRKKVESQRERLYWMLLHGYILTWATVYWAHIIEMQ